MAESVIFNPKDSKEDIYRAILPQIQSVIEVETDLVANLANVSAILKEVFDFFWVGFYWVKAEQLVLGPFQGPLACTRIRFGKGVCGTAWKEATTQLVADVDLFPGHIACSSASRSEIVVPLFLNGNVVGVLDVDSDQLNHFDHIDRHYLEQVARLIELTLTPEHC